MAEFSKQYDEEFGLGWYDFDYEDIFSNLKNNQYYPIICEGLGTLAVSKSDAGEMLFAIQSEEEPDMVEWKTLEEVIELVKTYKRGDI
jgi:hypothetical protein